MKLEMITFGCCTTIVSHGVWWHCSAAIKALLRNCSDDDVHSHNDPDFDSSEVLALGCFLACK